MQHPSLNKRDWSILLANSLDRFDNSLYSFLAPIMAPVFFPQYDSIVQIILAYSIHATSIITKPLGSFIFGTLAAKKGAIFGLYYSLAGVAIMTMLTAIIPSYDNIGVVSAVALIMIRTIKSFFAAGESTIAKLYIVENKEYQTAFRASYLYQYSSISGTIFASLISTLVIYFNEITYLWRICFAFGGCLTLMAYFLRYNIKLEENDKEIFSDYKIFSIKILYEYKFNFLKVMATTSLGHITYLIPFVVMNNLVPLVTSIGLKTMMSLNTALLVLDMLLIPIVGKLISKYNYLKVMYTSAGIIGITFFPLFIYIKDANLLYISFVRVWIVFWGIIFLCPLHLYYRELFINNPRSSYLVVGMANSFGGAITSAIIPSFCLGVWHFTQSLTLIGILISLISIITMMIIKL